MSEQQNVALIQSVYDAFKRGDLPFILARLTEDVDWTLEGPSIIPYAGKRKGIAQVKEFFEALGRHANQYEAHDGAIDGAGRPSLGAGTLCGNCCRYREEF
jgi:ketosteroid isomerase-like protein